MEVMTKGFELVREIKVGELEAPRSLDAPRPGAPAGRRRERRRRRLRIGLPLAPDARGPGRAHAADAGRRRSTREFRVGLGYDQPASPLASLGVMAAGSGDTASKYVARRETPLYIPENCTQCMECIAVCPDTALPNCSQDLDTILRTAITNYVDRRAASGRRCSALVPEIEKRHARDDARRGWRRAPARRSRRSSARSPTRSTASPPQAKTQFFDVIDKVPMAYQKTNAIFATPEKKKPGGGGIFSIFVSDLCKGCAACVTACGEHEALRMVQETEEVNAEHESGTAFLDLLPDTPQKYLGLYNDSRPQDSKTATLRNMLMVRRNYDALVSGDGACAGCGEKSILRAMRGGDRGVHASALSREGRSAAREGRPARQGRRRRSWPR